MSDAKHTPGEWVAGFDGHGGIRIVGNSGRTVVGYLCGTPTDAEQKANSRLVIAAPDLLAACEKLVTYTEACEGLLNASPAGQVIMARAAIAKAKGQPQ